MSFTTDELNVGSCAHCPLTAHGLALRAELLERGTIITGVAFSSEVEAVSDEFSDLLASLGIAGTDPDGDSVSSDDIATRIRQATASSLDANEQKITAIEASIKRNTRACDGPIKMRAPKAGRIIIATVCNSPYAPDGFSSETAHIDRQTSNE